MPNSLITPKMEYTETTWIVSHVNLGGMIPGHSALLIEGVLPGGRMYIAQMDMTAVILGEGSAMSRTSVGSLTNQKGVIREVRVFESETPGRDYTECSGASHYITPAKAREMIENIKTQQREVAGFWARHESDIPPTDIEIQAFVDKHKYQTYGKHLFFGKKGGGINCTEWCNDKLRTVGVAPGYISDNFPKPKISSGKCCVM